MLPSEGALQKHLQRAEYVFRLLFDSTTAFSDVYKELGPGWEMINGKVNVVWDNKIHEIKSILEKKKARPGPKACSCSAHERCTGKGNGCLSCYRSCRACNVKCKCKGTCNNPHNNGGTCDKCVASYQTHRQPPPSSAETLV